MSPREGWIKVKRRTATVGCNSTGEEYQLTCDGRQWNGRVPNCTVHGGRLSRLYTYQYTVGVRKLSVDINFIIIMVLYDSV